MATVRDSRRANGLHKQTRPYPPIRKDIPDYLTDEIARSRFIPPKGVYEEAQQALDWIDEHGRDEAEGATQQGLARARQIVRAYEEDDPIAPEYIRETAAFFERHGAQNNQEIAEEYEGEPWKDNGYLSWLLSGGDAGETDTSDTDQPSQSSETDETGETGDSTGLL